MGRDEALQQFPSTPAPEQQTRGEAAVAGENLKDRDLPFDNRHTLTFRVTGAASVARLEPLLLNRTRGDGRTAIWRRALSSGGGSGNSPATSCSAQLDFVWETTATKEQRQQHRNARVLNRLNGAQVRHLCAHLLHFFGRGASVSVLNLLPEPCL